MWPDNHRIWDVWLEVARTQWHTKIVGKRILYERLDYTAVWIEIKAHHVKKRDRGTVFRAIQEMELVALPILNEG